MSSTFSEIGEGGEGSPEADSDSKDRAAIWMHQLKAKSDSRTLLTPANISITRQQEKDRIKATLKSDLKKGSAFANKLKISNMSADMISQYVADTEVVNLKPYLSEIVLAVCEASFKIIDCPMIAKLCLSLFKKYEDFGDCLIEKIQQVAMAPIGSDEDSAKRRRIMIRLLIELFDEGVFQQDEFFIQLFSTLSGKVKAKSNAVSSNNTLNTAKPEVDSNSIQVFIKYGAEKVLGYPSKATRDVAREANVHIETFPVPCFTKPAVKDSLRKTISEMFDQLKSELLKSFVEFKRRSRKSEKYTQLNGKLTETMQAELDTAKKRFDNLFSRAGTFSECIGEDIPPLQEEPEEEEAEKTASSSIIVWDTSAAADTYNGPYGDSESRSFYEDLPDLLSMVPPGALGLTSEQVNILKEKLRVQKERRASEGGGSEGGPADGSGDSAAAADSSTEKEEEGGSGTETPQAKLNVLLDEELPSCTSKSKCDDFCVKFCFLNSKNARKKLSVALSKIPYGRSDLPAYYARILASLCRIFPEIAEPTLESVKAEMTFLTKNKTQLTYGQIETKSRILRYVGELVKFGVAFPMLALRTFKGFLDDMTPQNVELFGALSESCGRYLYLLPLTRERMDTHTQTLLRLRKVRVFDLRVVSLIDQAYFAIIPPAKKNRTKKVLSDIEKYIRYLLYQKLCSKSPSYDIVDSVIKSLRRLPFSDPTHPNLEMFIIKCAMKLSRYKYSSTCFVADCISGLSRFRPLLVGQMIDTIIEELFRGMESPYKRDPQRMIGLTKLLGELYNYQAIPAPIIFDMLYNFINVGHSLDSVTAVSASSSSTVAAAAAAATATAIPAPSMQAAGASPAGPNSGTNSISNPARSGLYCINGCLSYSNNYISSIVSQAHAAKDFMWAADAGGSVSAESIASKQHRLVEKIFKMLRDPSRFHPKIYSDIDPPNDLFRALLVVELINTSGEYYVNHLYKKKLDDFLLYFQRYLNHKIAVPLHVEYAILDMYDRLDEERIAALKTNPKLAEFERKINPDVVQAKIDEIEAKFKADIAIYGGSDIPTEDKEGDDDDSDDDGDGDGDGEGEGEDRLGSRKSKAEGEEDGDEDDSSSSSSSDSSSSSSDSDDADEDFDDDDENEDLLDVKGFRKANVEEDEEFDRSFQEMMRESTESARLAQVKNVDKMSRPSVLPALKNQIKEPSLDSNSNPQEFVFKFLSRDREKNKIQTKGILVPTDTSFVSKLKKNEEEAQLERQRIKNITLQLEMLSASGNGTSKGVSGSGSGSGSGALDTSGGDSGESSDHVINPSQQHRRALSKRGGPPSTGGVVGTLDLSAFLADSSKAEISRANEMRGINSSGIKPNNTSGGGGGGSNPQGTRK